MFTSKASLFSAQELLSPTGKTPLAADQSVGLHYTALTNVAVDYVDADHSGVHRVRVFAPNSLNDGMPGMTVSIIGQIM